MIQIDMEMPEKCGLCPLFHAEHPMHCQGVKADCKKKIVAPYGQPRPDWCPLHEVTADPDTVSRQAVIECLEHLSACDESFVEIGTDDETFIGKYEAITEISDLPSSPTLSRPTGYWMRMSDLNESEDDRYKCSCCGNVVHHRDKVFLYTYNSWCGACGANMNSKNYATYMQGGAPQ